jgi:hypothetical protein
MQPSARPEWSKKIQGIPIDCYIRIHGGSSGGRGFASSATDGAPLAAPIAAEAARSQLLGRVLLRVQRARMELARRSRHLDSCRPLPARAQTCARTSSPRATGCRWCARARCSPSREWRPMAPPGRRLLQLAGRSLLPRPLPSNTPHPPPAPPPHLPTSPALPPPPPASPRLPPQRGRVRGVVRVRPRGGQRRPARAHRDAHAAQVAGGLQRGGAAAGRHG